MLNPKARQARHSNAPAYFALASLADQCLTSKLAIPREETDAT